MEILRKNMPNISKFKFTDNMFVEYSDEQLLFMGEALKDVIINYPISTIDSITYLRNHYTNSLLDAIDKITDKEANNIRFNCIYQSRVLKDILSKRNITGYYVSYKAINFTTMEADELIKESHTSIFVPTIIDDKKYFIILEPGLKIDKPIYLCGEKYINEYDNLKIEIGKSGNKDYPLYLSLDGVNKYSYNKTPHKVYQEFNPNYYTINPISIVIPCAYKYLYGYRANNFSLDVEKRMSLTIYPVEEKIVIYNDKAREFKNYLYDEITKDLLLEILPGVCEPLNLNCDDTINNILFMKEVKDLFIQMMDKNTVKTYLKK